MNASPVAIGSSTRRRLDSLLSAYTKEFAEEHNNRVFAGVNALKTKRLAFVGLARNCGAALAGNLHRVRDFSERCLDWRALVFENDSTDDTKIIANAAQVSCPNVCALTHDFGRTHKPMEFAGPRTIELAEYRAGCQDWVRKNCADFDYVVALDWDSWGGWWGAETSFGLLEEMPEAFGMASVSLLEMPIQTYNVERGEIDNTAAFIHYDSWALRLNSYWDDYGNGFGAWKASWIPGVGTLPIRVCSAFGGFCIYRTRDYLCGAYSGEDCEHVPFHRSIAEQTGRALYLNPSMRTIMQWTAPDDELLASTGRCVPE